MSKEHDRPIKEMPKAEAPVRPTSGLYSRPYTICELAAIFELNRNTMSQWLRNGNVKAKRVASRWRVELEELPAEFSQNLA